ncbi:NAD-dependent epimerase/dehydratase family protein [Candidatus Woesearchaeota archaeon]|nr:NAD-dependent epimerase/dehydratase family protein [Candidatus Woesearchaeota archaeon]
MLLKEKTVLVTGGAGFIGSHLVDRCLKEGAGKVKILDNLNSGKVERLKDAINDQRVEFIQGSITDYALTRYLVQKSDYVFHEAAAKLVHSLKAPFSDIETNVLGSSMILEAARGSSRTKIIHASTGSVLGSSIDRTPMKEESPKNPSTVYGISKNAVESYCKYYAKNFGIDVRVLRYFHVFGPREDPEGEVGVISIFLSRILKGESPIVFGGKQLRCFTYIDDIVEANMLMLRHESETVGEVYNVASKTRISIEDLAKKLIRKYNPGLEITYRPERLGENYYPVPDTTKIEQLGFRESISFEEGIDRTAEWIKRNYLSR